MKKCIIFICLISLTIFCSCFGKSMKYEIDPDEKAVNTAMARNSKALANKYHMRPFGVGVAMPEGDIQYLELQFQIQGPLSKEQIRKFLVDSTQDFLKDINSDSILCFYLKNHSLTIKDIGITLFIIDSSGRGLRDPYIGIADLSKGELEYDILVETYDVDLKLNIPSFKSKCHESYIEALREIDRKS